jgi:hypothetical protein
MTISAHAWKTPERSAPAEPRAIRSPQRRQGRFDEVLRSPGQPLDATVRAFMEACFGHDFSRVRVHADAAAAASAAAAGASAYTFGTHIVFGAGRFHPGTAASRDLIAHELAHTIQQRGGGFATPADAPAREREADLAAEDVAAGRRIRTLTPSGLGVACQRPPGMDLMDAHIMQTTVQLQMPLLPARLRAQLLARLRQLEDAWARSVGGGPGGADPSPTATPAEDAAASQAREAALEEHINNHPVWDWGFGGGKGSFEGYAEIEANTSSTDFERTDLFRDWYYRGWAAIRSRPDPGNDLKTLAFRLITDPAKRAEFLASVGLAGESMQPVGPPRSLKFPLDLARMSAAEKRVEIDAIRGWQQRQQLAPDVQDRLTEWLSRLLTDLEKGRTLEAASMAASPPVTSETREAGIGARPGFGGGFGKYANVDLDFMLQGRNLDFPKSEYPFFNRFLHGGAEISSQEAWRLMAASPKTEIGILEPSIGPADGFVVLPEVWSLENGDQLTFERWVVIRKPPAEAERWRRMIVSTHRGRTLPGGADLSGMGQMGGIGLRPGGPPMRVPGVRSSWKRGGGPVTGPVTPSPRLTEPPEAGRQSPRRHVYSEGELHEVKSQPEIVLKRGTARPTVEELEPPRTTRPEGAARDERVHREVAAKVKEEQRGITSQPGLRWDNPWWSKQVERLEKNAAGGRLNEEYLRQALRGKLAAEFDDLAHQVRIRPNKPDGKPADFYFIADHLGRSKGGGGIVAIDGKLTPSSPLTNPQAIGYPMLGRNGGTVISKNQPRYPHGTKIPPSPALRAEPTVDLWTTPRPPGGEIEFKLEPID